MSDNNTIKNKPIPPEPYAVMTESGEVMYCGMHYDEQGVWEIALGWPDELEINTRKNAGWYVTKVELRPIP